MSDQQNTSQSAILDHVNHELTLGLKLCHSLIHDYRSKLASRLNDNKDEAPANDDGLGNDESDRA